MAAYAPKKIVADYRTGSCNVQALSRAADLALLYFTLTIQAHDTLFHLYTNSPLRLIFLYKMLPQLQHSDVQL